MADYTYDRVIGGLPVPLAAQAATVTGPSVDFGRPGVPKPIACNVLATAVSGTSPTMDVKLQEADDDLTFTDIPGATTTQIIAAGNRVINGYTTKRYVRAVSTLGGSAGPTVTMAIWILSPVSE